MWCNGYKIDLNSVDSDGRFLKFKYLWIKQTLFWISPIAFSLKKHKKTSIFWLPFFILIYTFSFQMETKD